MTTRREELTEKIAATRLELGLTWKKLGEAVGQSPIWTTAALQGQMSLSREQAEIVGEKLGLESAEIALLQQAPYRGSLAEAVPTDPLIYRFYELIQVYGTTIKELIHEEFGDGIMSAIDFEMKIDRVADPKGDRVLITLNGKFLPYKTY